MSAGLGAGESLERNDIKKRLEGSGRRTSCQWQAVQVMIGDGNDVSRRIIPDSMDRRNCDAFERTIEVPMLQPIRTTCDDRGFIAMHVISVIAVTMPMMTVAVMFVIMMMRLAVVVMDVRIISSAVPMMNYAHDRARSQSRYLLITPNSLESPEPGPCPRG